MPPIRKTLKCKQMLLFPCSSPVSFLLVWWPRPAILCGGRATTYPSVASQRQATRKCQSTRADAELDASKEKIETLSLLSRPLIFGPWNLLTHYSIKEAIHTQSASLALMFRVLIGHTRVVNETEVVKRSALWLVAVYILLATSLKMN